MGGAYLHNQKKINDLNEQISSKDTEIQENKKALSETEEMLSQKEQEAQKRFILMQLSIKHQVIIKLL